jgi:hypothetical protein
MAIFHSSLDSIIFKRLREGLPGWLPKRIHAEMRMGAEKQPLAQYGLFRGLYSETTKMGSSQWNLVLNYK